MKTKNTNQQVKNIVGNKGGNCSTNCKRAIPFYIAMVSITTIFALLLIFVLEKQENLKCINMGLIQKVQDGKVVWIKDTSAAARFDTLKILHKIHDIVMSHNHVDGKVIQVKNPQ